MPVKTTDLTVGRPLKKIFFFALPLVFGALFQQLYSFVDTIIIGRFLGETALGAVGLTFSLNLVILGFIQGCMNGFGVPISQAFGAKDPERVHRYFWNGVWLSLMIAVTFTIATVILTLPMLHLIHTPDSMLPQASSYIRMIFTGIPCTVLYNFSASVLRALGDSRRPFATLLFSCCLNIALDVLFVAVLPFGVIGAAVATVVSQALSGCLNVYFLIRKTDYFRIRKEEMPLSASYAKHMFIIGVPMGLEFALSEVGTLVMQYAINGLGTAAIAAQTAGEKIRQIFTLPMESVGTAMATYAAQNQGAGRYDRIKTGIRDALMIQYLYCAVVFVFLWFAGYSLVGLVLGETKSETALLAVEYLTRISMLFCFHGSLAVCRLTLQGMGCSVQAILSGVCELAGRSLGALLAMYTGLGFIGICYANPLAWIFALIFCVIMLTIHLRQIR